MARNAAVIGGGGDSALTVFDKVSGKEVARFPLTRRSRGTPMT